MRNAAIDSALERYGCRGRPAAGAGDGCRGRVEVMRGGHWTACPPHLGSGTLVSVRSPVQVYREVPDRRLKP